MKIILLKLLAPKDSSWNIINEQFCYKAFINFDSIKTQTFIYVYVSYVEYIPHSECPEDENMSINDSDRVNYELQ